MENQPIPFFIEFYEFKYTSRCAIIIGRQSKIFFLDTLDNLGNQLTRDLSLKALCCAILIVKNHIAH